MDPVSGEARARAVALPDRAGGHDQRAARDAEAAERVRPDDHANLAAAVVDHQAEPVGEIGRRANRDALHQHARVLAYQDCHVFSSTEC